MSAMTDETYWYKLEYVENAGAEHDRYYRVTFRSNGTVTETFTDEENRSTANHTTVFDNIKQWKDTFDTIKSRPEYIKAIKVMPEEEAEGEMVLEFI